MSGSEVGVGPVIAISGPPGAGKTTLCKAVMEQVSDGSLILWDDFETMTRRPPGDIQDWISRGSPYEEVEAPGLVEALSRASLRGPVVFETPLGRAHPETAALIDQSIWLACPNDIALARKIGLLSNHVAGSNASAAAEYLSWLVSYLKAYEEITHAACLVQKNRVEPKADLILNSLQGIELNVKKIISFL